MASSWSENTSAFEQRFHDYNDTWAAEETAPKEPYNNDVIPGDDDDVTDLQQLPDDAVGDSNQTVQGVGAVSGGMNVAQKLNVKHKDTHHHDNRVKNKLLQQHVVQGDQHVFSEVREVHIHYHGQEDINEKPALRKRERASATQENQLEGSIQNHDRLLPTNNEGTRGERSHERSRTFLTKKQVKPLVFFAMVAVCVLTAVLVRFNATEADIGHQATTPSSGDAKYQDTASELSSTGQGEGQTESKRLHGSSDGDTERAETSVKNGDKLQGKGSLHETEKQHEDEQLHDAGKIQNEGDKIIEKSSQQNDADSTAKEREEKIIETDVSRSNRESQTGGETEGTTSPPSEGAVGDASGDSQPVKTATVGVTTPLHEASNNGHTDVVKLFLKRRFELNAGDEEGQTPLHKASGSGHLDVVRLLLQHGFQVNVVDAKGRTPLILASAAGRLQVVKELIRHKANVKVTSHNKQTALSKACEYGHFEIFKLLLQHDARVDVEYGLDKRIDYHENWYPVYVEQATLLFIATHRGFYDIATLLLANKAFVDPRNKADDTPLGIASYKGHQDLVEILLMHGADAETKDRFGRTPFFKACVKGHAEIADRLLKVGVTVELKDINGETPFSAACARGRKDIVEMLLPLNPDMENRDKDEQTPLLAACYGNQTAVVKILLEHGALVNVESIVNRYTPLLLACEKGNADMLQMLLDYHAHLNVSTSGKGWTPLHIAIDYYGTLEVLRILLRHNLDINSRSSKYTDKITPLHLACENNREEMVRFLIEHKAEVNIQDSKGKTPLHTTAIKGRLEIMKILLDSGADASRVDLEGFTVLHHAVKAGQSEIVAFLIRKFPNLINLQSKKGLTALAAASQKGDMDMVAFLLKYDAQ